MLDEEGILMLSRFQPVKFVEHLRSNYVL